MAGSGRREQARRANCRFFLLRYVCAAFSHFCVRPLCCVFLVCRLCVAAAIHPDASSAFSFPPRTHSHLLSPLRLQFNLFLTSRSASLSCLSEDSHSVRLSLSIAPSGRSSVSRIPIIASLEPKPYLCCAPPSRQAILSGFRTQARRVRNSR